MILPRDTDVIIPECCDAYKPVVKGLSRKTYAPNGTSGTKQITYHSKSVNYSRIILEQCP